MKIRHPAIFAAIGWFGAKLIRCWIGSLRIRAIHEDPGTISQTSRQSWVYCLWHESMLVSAWVCRHSGIHVLISEHSDGEVITRIIKQLGYDAVRGSSTRGAVRALRGLTRSATKASLGITPDGPRGPRRVIQDGVTFLASRTGLGIVPVGCGFERPWRASSWDRFVLPRPFTRAVCYFGAPIHIPPDADAQGLAAARELVSAEMNRVTQLAESLVANPGLKISLPSSRTIEQPVCKAA